MADGAYDHYPPTARVIRPAELTPAELDAWADIAAGAIDYGSPVLQPAFASLVATARKDVRVALYERGPHLVGVFAFHRRPNGFARPVGGPFADYSGPLLRPDAGLSAEDCLRLAGVSVYRFSTLVDPWGVFADHVDGEGESHVIDISAADPDAYLEARRAAHPKRFKNFRRLRSQIERAGGKLELVSTQTDAEIFEKLSVWKRDQLRRSGLVDVLRPSGAGPILDAVASGHNHKCRGWVIGLKLNGELVAGHFGLRCPQTFHPWIAAYDPAHGSISPGNMLLREAVHEMPSIGLTRYDLAGGHDHYKKYYSNAAVKTYSGFIALDTPDGRRARRADAVWSRLGADKPGSSIGRLKRRLDHIAVCETGLIGRVSATVSAIVANLRHGQRQIGHTKTDS